ncbi:MAG: protein-lysine N-methyltransferase [Verrucomicrobia bacterium]|nr:protein-lysine N-methyltransferase [Verrucomicrobiota bacterium]
MVHPDTQLKLVSEEIGHGVFATHFIPKGTIVWVRDDLDQVFTPEEVATMAPIYQEILEKYSFVDSRGDIILCWDHSRFFNHACNANCMSAGYDFEIAVRDIQAGEELTDDYGTLNLRENFGCLCNHSECRKEIRPDDLERFAPHWDKQVSEAFFQIPKLKQPLWHLLKEKQEVEQALKDPALLRSIYCHYAPAA